MKPITSYFSDFGHSKSNLFVVPREDAPIPNISVRTEQILIYLTPLWHPFGTKYGYEDSETKFPSPVWMITLTFSKLGRQVTIQKSKIGHILVYKLDRFMIFFGSKIPFEIEIELIHEFFSPKSHLWPNYEFLCFSVLYPVPKRGPKWEFVECCANIDMPSHTICRPAHFWTMLIFETIE